MTDGPTKNEGVQAEEVGQRAAAVAQAMCEVLNLAGVLASPKLLSMATEFPSREHVVAHIDAFEAAIAGTSAGDDATRSATERLRSACACWTPGPEAPIEVREAARTLLSLLGCPEPPGGWDAFEGAPDAPEPKDPDPRPPPTTEEEAARPDFARVAAAVEWCRQVAAPNMPAELALAAWARGATAHVDTLLAALRPVRSNRTAVREKLLRALVHLEKMRTSCESIDTHAPPPVELQERARAVLSFLTGGVGDSPLRAPEPR